MVDNKDIWGKKFYGKNILEETKERLQPFKEEFNKRELKVAIIQFVPPLNTNDPVLLAPFFAANKSTEAKEKTFANIGITPVTSKLPWNYPEKDFEKLLTDLRGCLKSPPAPV